MEIKQNPNIRAGMGIHEAYTELLLSKSPCYVNFNGVYMYGGCKKPPHMENLAPESLRTKAAVWALQGVMSNVYLVREAEKLERDKVFPTLAKAAIAAADALIKQLNESE